MAATPSRASAYGAAAKDAKTRRRRRLTWLFVVVWASDWIFDWTGMLGFETLGSWLWLIGLLVLVYRSVVGTKLPEWLLTWAWMLGTLALWTGSVVWIEHIVREAEPWETDPELVDLVKHGGSYMAISAAILQTALATFMLGWAMGVLDVLLGSVGLGLAFRVRRSRNADEPGAPPTLSDRERQAHTALVVLQWPLFALAIAIAVAVLSAGLVMWRSGTQLEYEDAALMLRAGRVLTLAGLGAFVVGVMQLRQVLALRWCGRVRLVIATLLACAVLGGVIAFAVVSNPAMWIFAFVAFLWTLTQVSAVRVLWAVGRRDRA